MKSNYDAYHPNGVVNSIVDLGTFQLESGGHKLDKGCLVDQMVGQYMAHICGLGYLVEPKNVRSGLQSIMKYNYRESLKDHFNNMRSYAMGDESGLLMASWPKSRPKVPFPYFSEIMTGFEYTAAAGMIYEGMENEGIKVISNIRDRYDGVKRNPFNEIECGHHYARAMASWASVLAFTGFQYSAVDQSMVFAPKNGKHFWSNGYQYGTVAIDDAKEGKSIKLKVLQGGDLYLKSFTLANYGSKVLEETQSISEGQELALIITNNSHPVK